MNHPFCPSYQIGLSMRPIDPYEYDAATRLAPASCPLFAMGDRRSGRRLLADGPADAAVSSRALSPAAGQGYLLGLPARIAGLVSIFSAAFPPAAPVAAPVAAPAASPRVSGPEAAPAQARSEEGPGDTAAAADPRALGVPACGRVRSVSRRARAWAAACRRAGRLGSVASSGCSEGRQHPTARGVSSETAGAEGLRRCC
jgi:hypothetical protein